MKEFQKGILDNDRVISAENVQRMGEVIALCAIKLSLGNLHLCFKSREIRPFVTIVPLHSLFILPALDCIR